MLKAYLALVAMIFGTLSLGLYYDRKLVTLKLKSAEKKTQTVTGELRTQTELVTSLRATAERLSKAHMESQKNLQAAEINYEQAKAELAELHKKPEFSAWANAVIPDDADSWLRNITSTDSGDKGGATGTNATSGANSSNQGARSARQKIKK